MRLRRLALSGIGPFRGEEVIDFDTLTRSGLFLIEGPTGAGKSTIIDAITYALYGSVAGGRESTTDRIRSDLADSRTPSYVELEFDVSGSTYLVWRQPAYSRPKMRGEGFIKENAKQSLRALDGSMEPITDAKEIAAAIQRLLGLSVEHFRKLVVSRHRTADRGFSDRASSAPHLLPTLALARAQTRSHRDGACRFESQPGSRAPLRISPANGTRSALTR